MKNKILSLFSVLFAFAIGAFIFLHTQNVLAAGSGVFLTSFAVNTAFDINHTITGTFCSLYHVRKTACGQPNPGGGNKIWLAPVDQFDGNWGHEAVNATIQAGPTMKSGFAGWIELEVSDNSLKLDQMLKGVAGHQVWENGFEVKVAGDGVDQTRAVQSLVNTEVVAIIQLNDLKRKNIGNTIFPLTLEISHTTGAKGTDQRGWTIKGKHDGIAQPSYFLKSSVVIAVYDDSAVVIPEP